TASATYELDPVSVTLTGRGISSMKFNTTYIECTSGCPTSTANNTTISLNHAPAVFYLDAALNYKVDIGGADSTLYFTAKNIFNRDPPFAGASNAYLSMASVGANQYDIDGTVYRVGIRFKM